MSILIKGMEMPKYTTKAEFGIDADGNPLCMVYHEDGTEPDIYDVVPLQAGHGRLIDADALTAAYTPDGYDRNKMHITKEAYDAFNLSVRGMKSIIKKAPTIIEAERGDG